MKVAKDAIVSQMDLLHMEILEIAKEAASMKNQVGNKVETWTNDNISQINGIRRDILMVRDQLNRLSPKIV